MKTVNYLGQDYEVPDHANYIAADNDLEIWWYQKKPRRLMDCWVLPRPISGDCGLLGCIVIEPEFPLLKI